MRTIDFADGFETEVQPTVVTVDASDVSVTPSGNLASTDAQSALEELQADIDTRATTAAMNAADASTLATAEAYTDTKVAALVNSAPSTLDTLKELADALGDDPNFATTTATSLGNRLRVDTAAQGLTGTQKTNAKTNIDLQNVDNTSDATKNVLSATKLTTARTINGVSFDGTANITVADSTKEPAITSGTTSQFLRGDKTFTQVPLASAVSGTLPIGNGGTGQTTQQAAINALTGTQSSGKYLRSDGTNATLSTIQAADIPTLNQNTTGTASNVTGTVAIANGGTGATTKAGAFDALSPMTTAGDIIIGGTAGTGTRLAVGSNGNVLTLVGGAPAWQAPSAANSAWNVVSKTTTYTAVANDYIYASGASFTITLPTAASISGQQICIEHAGTSLSQVYTLNTTSSQTIGGVASGSYALYTAGEVLKLVSDGSNWRIIDHKTKTDWISSSTASGKITAITTSPTFNVGVGFDYCRWMRDGRFAIINYAVENTTAGSAGSGDYLIAYPTNIALDTTLIPGITSATTLFTSRDAQKSIIHKISSHLCIGGSSTTYSAQFYAYDSTKFRQAHIAAGNAANWGSGSFSVGNNDLSWTCTVVIPVSGWQP